MTIIYVCKMIISSGVFFHFFQNFVFFREVKGEKMVQIDKKFCLSHSISQEPYLIWFSFVVHMCKMIISPGVFLFFPKFWLFGLLGGSKGKKWSKMTKSSVRHTLHIRNHLFMCKMIISPGFSFFQKFDFLGC